jgi:hypothetical protein
MVFDKELPANSCACKDLRDNFYDWVLLITLPIITMYAALLVLAVGNLIRFCKLGLLS